LSFSIDYKAANRFQELEFLFSQNFQFLLPIFGNFDQNQADD